MFTNLQRSLNTVYFLLERPRVASRVVAVLLAIHTLLLGYSAYVHSPTLNEPAHLVAGLSHWKFERFELYPVNPPLVRMVAAMPVMAFGYDEDWNDYDESPGARPEIHMGEKFVAINGNRSFFLFTIARWACIPFSWLGLIVCFLWARDLYGAAAGGVAASIWCFEPNILAHASLITPDAHATALGLATCYTFWRWLKAPNWMQAALTGFLLGLAELSKTTLIVLFPLWPAIWIAYWWPNRAQTPWIREGSMLIFQMAIGLCVLNCGYAFEGTFTRLGDFHFVSDLFTSMADCGQGRCDVCRPLYITNSEGTDYSAIDMQHIIPSGHGPTSGKGYLAGAASTSVNRFANSWLGYLPIPLPKSYLLGVDLQQKDFEHYYRPSYLRGVWRSKGWWYYYLYACGIKVPLALWALGFIALCSRVSRQRWTKSCSDIGPQESFAPHAGQRQLEPTQSTNNRSISELLKDEIVLTLPAFVIFATASVNAGFSEHIRYVLPAFPYLFIAVAQCARIVSRMPGRDRKLLTAGERSLLTQGRRSRYSPLSSLGAYVCPNSSRRKHGSCIALISCLVWFIVSSLTIYPHSLSYFNELIGGPRNGHNHLLSSNIDWGQDYLYLRTWLDKHPSVTVPQLAIYGLQYPFDTPRLQFVNPNTGTGGIKPGLLEAGNYAVSVNFVHGVARIGASTFSVKSSIWQKLDKLFPASRTVPISYSIYLYQVNPQAGICH